MVEPTGGAGDYQAPFEYGGGTYQDPMDPDAAAASQDAAAMSDSIAADEVINTVQAVSETDETNLVMNTILFWTIVVAVIFMVGKYSDSILDWLRRLAAPVIGGEEGSDALQAQKLSGGDENSEASDSLGSKIMEFAEVSKETLKKTLVKGKQTLKGAAETVQ